MSFGLELGWEILHPNGICEDQTLYTYFSLKSKIRV